MEGSRANGSENISWVLASPMRDYCLSLIGDTIPWEKNGGGSPESNITASREDFHRSQLTEVGWNWEYRVGGVGIKR